MGSDTVERLGGGKAKMEAEVPPGGSWHCLGETMPGKQGGGVETLEPQVFCPSKVYTPILFEPPFSDPSTDRIPWPNVYGISWSRMIDG